jgi:hypothetical protein
MRRMASEVPTTLIEIAKLRSTDDESPWVVDEELDEDEAAVPNVVLVADKELDEDEEAVPDVVLVLVLVCDVEEIIDEVIEGSRTSKMNISTTAYLPPAGMVTKIVCS